MRLVSIGAAICAAAAAAAAAWAAAPRPALKVHVELPAPALVENDATAVVVYDAEAATLADPVRWDVVIMGRYSSKALSRFGATDDPRDPAFGKSELVGSCPTAEDCRVLWYALRPNLLELQIDAVSDPRWVDPAWPGSIFHVVKDYLTTKCGRDEAEAARIVERIARRLRTERVSVLSLRTSPADPGRLLLYVREVEQFVPLR